MWEKGHYVNSLISNRGKTKFPKPTKKSLGYYEKIPHIVVFPQEYNGLIEFYLYLQTESKMNLFVKVNCFWPKFGQW